MQHLHHPLASIEELFKIMKANQIIYITSKTGKVLIKKKKDFWHTLIARSLHFNQKIYKIPTLLGYTERTVPDAKIDQQENMHKLLDEHISSIAKKIFDEVVEHRSNQNIHFIPSNENTEVQAFEDMPDYIFYDEDKHGKLKTYRRNGIVQPFPRVNIQPNNKQSHLETIREETTIILRNLLYQLL
jgi:hypothetical protein